MNQKRKKIMAVKLSHFPRLTVATFLVEHSSAKDGRTAFLPSIKRSCTSPHSTRYERWCCFNIENSFSRSSIIFLPWNFLHENGSSRCMGSIETIECCYFFSYTNYNSSIHPPSCYQKSLYI